MNTNGEVWSGSDLKMPSGSEVESATFHTAIPDVHDHGHHALPPHTMRDRVDELKSRGVSKLHDAQRSVSSRAAVVKSNVSNRAAVMKTNMSRSVANASSSVRTGVNSNVTKMQTSMRDSPMKWAGIAAGSGFALGLVGRLLERRRHQMRHMRQLVVIESTC